MEAFAAYLVKSTLWITAFTLVYLIFLKGERFFGLKRIYLISGIFFSLLFPLITFHYKIDMPLNYERVSGEAPFIVSDNSEEREFSYFYIIAGIYVTGIILLIGKSIYQFYSLLHTIHRSEVESLGSARLIRNSGYVSSFSFLNYVFVNPSISGDEQKEIINHELVHVTQKHWFDLLLSEMMLLLQWANPFMWIYTGFIRLNHEYIADELALQRSSDPAVYKAALLNQIFSGPVISLSNSFNYSVTKTRFDMMKKIITSPYRKYKLLFIMPVIATVFYAFAEPEYNYISVPAALEIVAGNPIIAELQSNLVAAPDTNEKDFVKSPAQSNEDTEERVFQFVEEPASYPGGDPALLEHIKANLKYPPEALAQGIKGKVTIRFLVAKDGSVKNASVLVGVHPLLDEESVRVVKTLKPFKPGMQGGVPVNQWYLVPITFDTDKKVVSKSPEQSQQEPEEKIFQIVEDPATYPGGETALLEDVRDNLKYPPEAITQGIKGRVTIRFMIAKDGSVNNAHVLVGVHPLLDEEALRVVNTLKPFKPGMQGGSPVNQWYLLPITFGLH